MMKHGDVFWVDLSPTQGSEIKKTRPCVLIGATPINQARRTVLGVPLSSSGKPVPPLTVPVVCMGKNVVAVCDQLRAIDKSRLLNRVESMNQKDLEKIKTALRQILCL